MTREPGEWLRYDNPDEKLPWLEPANEFEREPSGMKGKLIAGVVAAIAVIALIFGGMTWYRNRDLTGASGEAQLIKAPAKPYKVKPDEPGGMDVEGRGDTVYATGAGGDPGGSIDLSAMPEEPVARKGPAMDTTEVATADLPASTAAQSAQPQPAQQPRPAAKPAPAQTSATLTVKNAPATAPKPAAKPAAAPATAQPIRTGTGSYGLQLGAFSSAGAASSAWKVISGRFTFIAALNKSVEPVASGGKTLYRLRATGIASRASAENLCGRMKVTGDSCVVVGP